MAQSETDKKAVKKYMQSDKGKAKYARANAKSKGKKFILEYATLEELEVWKQLIVDREKELRNK